MDTIGTFHGERAADGVAKLWCGRGKRWCRGLLFMPGYRQTIRDKIRRTSFDSYAYGAPAWVTRSFANTSNTRVAARASGTASNSQQCSAAPHDANLISCSYGR